MWTIILQIYKKIKTQDGAFSLDTWDDLGINFHCMPVSHMLRICSGVKLKVSSSTCYLKISEYFSASTSYKHFLFPCERDILKMTTSINEISFFWWVEGYFSYMTLINLTGFCQISVVDTGILLVPSQQIYSSSNYFMAVKVLEVISDCVHHGGAACLETVGISLHQELTVYVVDTLTFRDKTTCNFSLVFMFLITSLSCSSQMDSLFLELHPTEPRQRGIRYGGKQSQKIAGGINELMVYSR